ncbi:MAG: hypothetical protein Q7S92_02785 [Candidatus Diapherotrites archaeon]|nr:hypothetical protein [Candidatus Diapherotrites archaeon]
MGLYKEGMDIDFSKIKWILLALAIVLILAGLYFTLTELLKPNALQISLEQNPLLLSQKDFTKLKVTVSNVTQETAQNVLVTVKPIATEALLIDGQTENTKSFGIIATNENRKDEFLIRANPGKTVLAGDYKLLAETTINGQYFKQEITLTVQ